jgi:hypothetical protein
MKLPGEAWLAIQADSPRPRAHAPALLRSFVNCTSKSAFAETKPFAPRPYLTHLQLPESERINPSKSSGYGVGCAGILLVAATRHECDLGIVWLHLLARNGVSTSDMAP